MSGKKSKHSPVDSYQVHWSVNAGDLGPALYGKCDLGDLASVLTAANAALNPSDPDDGRGSEDIVLGTCDHHDGLHEAVPTCLDWHEIDAIVDRVPARG